MRSTTALDPGAGLTECRVTAGARAFRTVRAGSGQPTVVFESGMSACASEWVAVQRVVAERTATLSYDRSGYGGSDVAHDGRRLADLAADLETVLTGAEVTGPLVLVGHSWGCPILRTFVHATQRPVAGIVLVDGTVSAVMTDADAQKAQRMFTMLARLSRVSAHRGWWPALLRNVSSGLESADVEVLLRDMTRGSDLRAARREADALLVEAADLPRLEAAGFPAGVPVTFVVGAQADRGGQGERDRLISSARAETDLRHARLVLAEHSSHFVPQQQPQLVADEILALVS